MKELFRLFFLLFHGNFVPLQAGKSVTRTEKMIIAKEAQDSDNMPARG